MSRGDESVDMKETLNSQASLHDHKKLNRLNVAWKGGDIKEFEGILVENMADDKDGIDSFLNKLIQESNDKNNYSANKVYWDILFNNSVHLKTFQTGKSLLYRLVDGGNTKVLKLLFDHEGFIHRDAEGNTALHYAAKIGNEAAMLEILETCGDIGFANKENEIPLTWIPANVLKTFLDGRIKENPTSNDDDYNISRGKLEFDCRFLQRSDSGDRNGPTSIMLLDLMRGNPEQRQLLSHPVLATFALKKWDKMRIMFILNLTFYTILCSFLTFNTLWKTIYGCELLLSTRILQGLFLFLLMLRELFEAFIQKGYYFKQYENYLELSVVAIGGYLSFAGCADDLILCYQLGVVVTVFCWLGLFLLIGKQPFYSKMFLIVLSTFFQISIFLVVITAFTMSFFVLFSESSDLWPGFEFFDILKSIDKSLLMISVEFDLANFPFENYPGTSVFIFILFVLVIAFVLRYLFFGLAERNTEKLKENALILDYESRVKYLAYLDKLILGLPESLSKKIRKYFAISDYIIPFISVKPDSNRGFIFKSFKNFFYKNVEGFSTSDVSDNAYRILNENYKLNAEKQKQDEKCEIPCNLELKITEKVIITITMKKGERTPYITTDL